jgi:hypothetical protein
LTTNFTTSTDKRYRKYLTVAVQLLPHAGGDNSARRAATPYLRYLLFKSSSSFRVRSRDSRFNFFPSKINIQQSSLGNPFLMQMATSRRGGPPRPTFFLVTFCSNLHLPFAFVRVIRGSNSFHQKSKFDNRHSTIPSSRR